MAPRVPLTPALQPRGGLHGLHLTYSLPCSIIIHHDSQVMCALLSEKKKKRKTSVVLKAIHELFFFLVEYFLLYRYSSHDVFSFIINLSMGAHFYAFLNVILFMNWE